MAADAKPKATSSSPVKTKSINKLKTMKAGSEASKSVVKSVSEKKILMDPITGKDGEFKSRTIKLKKAHLAQSVQEPENVMNLRVPNEDGSLSPD